MCDRLHRRQRPRGLPGEGGHGLPGQRRACRPAGRPPRRVSGATVQTTVRGHRTRGRRAGHRRGRPLQHRRPDAAAGADGVAGQRSAHAHEPGHPHRRDAARPSATRSTGRRRPRPAAWSPPPGTVRVSHGPGPAGGRRRRGRQRLAGHGGVVRPALDRARWRRSLPAPGRSPRGRAARRVPPRPTTDDGRELAVGSVPVGGASDGRHHRDRRGAGRPAGGAGRQRLDVLTAPTLRGTRVRAQWYDVSTATWRALTTTTQGLDEATVDVDLATIDQHGSTPPATCKVRLIADHGKPFDLAVDRVAVTAVNRR